jgi:hypothetical protein
MRREKITLLQDLIRQFTITTPVQFKTNDGAGVRETLSTGFPYQRDKKRR